MKWLTSIVTNRDLFPGKWGFAIFVAYMGLFINQGLYTLGRPLICDIMLNMFWKIQTAGRPIL